MIEPENTSKLPWSRRIGAIACAGALMLAGCGDSGDDTSTGAQSPEKAAFIKQADKICLGTIGKLAVASQDLPRRPSKAQQEGFVKETVIPALQDRIDRLAKLTPPPGDEDVISELLDKQRQALEQLKNDPTQPSTVPFSDSYNAAGDYGFKVCGGKPQPLKLN